MKNCWTFNIFCDKQYEHENKLQNVEYLKFVTEKKQTRKKYKK